MLRGATYDGKPVLVILISRKDPHAVQLLTGTAQWTGDHVKIVPNSNGPAIDLDAVDSDTNAFNPDVLPSLVADDRYLPLVNDLRQRISWCVPVFVDKPRPDATSTPGLLGAVAGGPDGKLFIFQVRESEEPDL